MNREPKRLHGSEKSRVLSNIDVLALETGLLKQIELLESVEAHVAAAHVEAAIEALFRQFNMERITSKAE